MVRRQRLWVGLFLLLLAAPVLHTQTSSPPLALAERPGGETIRGAVADGSGGVWVTGYTFGSLPVSAGALQPSIGGSQDAFVMHVGADGSVLYATYLGGAYGEAGSGIARDAAGNIYVVGNTTSADFPTTAGALQPAAPGASAGQNAFVVKLDPTGKHILYSTYLGGTSTDAAFAVAVDAAGSAAVVGMTQGFGFPTTWGRCLSYSTSQNSSFYTRLSADGRTALFSTCLDDSTATGVTLDRNGDAYVVGQAQSEFGPRSGSYVGSYPAGASSQGFLTKFVVGASYPIPYSMFLGGESTDSANGVAVTSKGIYVAGGGYSHTYPGGATRPPEPHTATLDDGRQITYEGETAWIMKVSLDGSQVLGTTLINGNGDSDEARALQVDSLETVHVTGYTTSTDLPTSADAPQRTFGGRVDAWYAQAWMPNNITADPTYLTYLGGTTTDRGYTLSLDGTGGAWIGGESDSSDFPNVHAKTSATTHAFMVRYGQPVASTPVPGSDVVLYAKDASPIVGSWQLVADTSAAGGTRIWNPDAGVPKISTPAVNPANYFELTFNANAGVPYHLWLRMRAENDSYQNDSVWVQFSDSVDGSGGAIWRSGTTSGTAVSLEDCGGCGEQGWGWNDNGYGTAGVPVYFAATGPHTIRIQQREDGVSIDQIVLSSGTWASSAPGASKNDSTIVPQSSTPSTTNRPPAVAITSPANGTSYTQSSWLPVQASASDSDGTVARVDFFANSTLLWTSQAAPYGFTWESVPAGTYALTAVATDNAGASTTSAPITVTIAPSGGGLSPFFGDADVGDVGAAGNATYSNGTFTVQGSGADVWGTADAFNYVNETLARDGAVIARVASVSAEANWVKAGVMIRGSLSPDSAQAFMLVSHAKGVCFQRRVFAGGTSASTCGTMSTAPRWVKLERRGDVIAGYESADGTTWTLVGSDTFTFPVPGVYAGLAVSSHIRGTLSTATFDNVHVIDAVGPNKPPTVTLTSPADGASFTAPAMVAIAVDTSDDDWISRIDFYANATLIGTVSGSSEASHYDFTWSNVAAGRYTLTAVATDSQGATTTSSPVTITVGDAPVSGGECSSVTLSRTSFYSGGPASDWTIAVTAPDGTCTWTASVDQAWLLLGGHPGPATITGTGSGTVRLQTLDNHTGAYRYGTFTIGGVAYRVTQEPY